MRKIFNKIGVILTLLLCLIVAFLMWFNLEYFGINGFNSVCDYIGNGYAL